MTSLSSLPGTGDSNYTLFQSALPITSDAWLSVELKNGFSFFISTRCTEQELFICNHQEFLFSLIYFPNSFFGYRQFSEIRVVYKVKGKKQIFVCNDLTNSVTAQWACNHNNPLMIIFLSSLQLIQF